MFLMPSENAEGRRMPGFTLNSHSAQVLYYIPMYKITNVAEYVTWPGRLFRDTGIWIMDFGDICRGCAGSPETSLVAYVISTIIS